MENENETLDSTNEDTGVEDKSEDTTALEEKVTKLEDTNRQLFARAKKAEGFELKDGEWLKPEPQEKPAEPEKSDEIDFAQLAFHNSRSDSLKIEHEEDVEFLKQAIEETGKAQKDILTSKWFQSDLKERIEKREVVDATPQDNKRSTVDSKSDVDYWMKRDELPSNTPDNKELREKIVDARYKMEKSVNKFSSNPIVEG